MSIPFRIGISPDFYTQARDHLEAVLRERLEPLHHIECSPMPELHDLHAPPEVMDRYDAIFALALRVDAASLAGVTRPAIVARWGVGYDRIDTQALTAADIVLTITPAAVRRPVAEAIFTFLFALAKNLPVQDRVARAGLWRDALPRFGRDIAGSVLGSVGCGNIAREMFRVARPLGFARLLACDPYVSQEQVESLGVELTGIDTVFRESDFVVINTLLNASTHHLVGERHLRLMKPSAFLINTARGPIVDHDALVRALRERWIAGAGIDVYPVEPPPPDEPLFTLDNVILAPHAMAWTANIMRNNGLEACENILAVAAGTEPPSPVNREVLSRPGFQAKLARFRG